MAGAQSTQERLTAIQTKKGDRSLPKINYFCIAMYNQLTSEQMYEIYLGIKRKWSISRISREIEVSATTVLREIRRNSNANGYNPIEINLRNVVSKNVTVKNYPSSG